MKKYCLLILAVLGIVVAPTSSRAQDPFSIDGLLAARLSDQELEQGWIRLFDGQTLMGWEDAGKANWRVESGAIKADAGENGLLCTTVPFSDYELVIEFFPAERTNSGVFLRTPGKPKDPALDCFELNVAPTDNPFPTGSFVYRQKISEQINAPKPNVWHEFKVLLQGAHAEVWLDGRKCVDYQDTTQLKSGLIGLQFREGPIAFRNIKIRPLGDIILPGKKEDFQAAGDLRTEWSDRGSLTMIGGKGRVETKAQVGDGFIQVVSELLAEKVNSGIFFRCIPGEDMNGYECQLNHAIKESRLVPLDAGTGAIYRRQVARAVLSDEGKKTYTTIVAAGPRIATWVQGIQVVDWVDTRKPDPNPRKGLRTEAGTIMLQGHDPGSKVRFDLIRVGKIN
jgi:hypothetical protein